MKISINIQSYKRAGAVDTLGVFNKPNLWVHKFEYNDYKKEYPSTEVRQLPDNLRGNLPMVKNYIFNIEKKKNDFVLFVDDDIGFVGMFENNIMVKLSPKTIDRILIKNSFLCQEWGFRLWGINLNIDKQNYREYTPFSTLSYVSSSFACFSKENKLLYDERLPLKEDYDMTIQQCNEYRGLLRFNKFFYSKKGAENVGGCATYRNLEKEKEQLDLLREKWGGDIVKFDNSDRSHRTKKIKKQIDINPIIKVPIKGI